jgi:hypothetical protein
MADGAFARSSRKDRLARVAIAVRNSPLLLTLMAMALACAAISPWGNYPLNDDWTYSHLAKTFAETGRIHVDVPVAANAIGQALLGGALIKLFGFSHTILRISTLILGGAGLWAIDRLLFYVTPGKSIRLLSLLLLAFNPIYFYSATTFMSELHGWVPAILVAVLWFWDRRRLAAAGDRLITLWVAIAVGALCGSTFWTRQFAVLVYPALLTGTLLRFALLRRWRAIARSIPALALGSIAFVAVIWAFFVWSRATGNYRPEFAGRLNNLWRFEMRTYGMQAGSALVYLTGFFLPLLALLGWSGRRRWLVELGAVPFVLLGLVARHLFETHAPSEFWVGPFWVHRVFPFVVNVVYNAGLGPITLDDVFFYDAAKPSWPRYVWTSLELVFIAASALWSPVSAKLTDAARRAKDEWSVEVLFFAAALTVGSLFAIIQANQDEMADRYYIPLIFGAAILIPGVLATSHAYKGQPYQNVKFAVLFAPIALFSVLGAHDEFRWNDARWKLVDLAMTSGGTRSTVQGGWEVNCWYKAEGYSPEELACQNGCRCAYTGFCCVDDRWRIGMSISAGYKQVAAIKPTYWLASGPAVVLSRRDMP